jgi:protein involved in polysaccharide export with SLBB domain
MMADPMMRSARRCALAVAALLAAQSQVAAQAAGLAASSGANLTRAELEVMLARSTEAAVAASAAPVRVQARTEAALIRSRLAAGDLFGGDRIALAVAARPELTDTFTVSAGRSVTLPGSGEIALRGVLRSELADHLSAHISRTVAEPAVEARVLIAIEVAGAVERPGLYAVPAELRLADVLSVAGGATLADAEARTRIRRGREVIWEGHALHTAALMGLSLDQLSLAAGDVIELPGTGSGLGALLRNGLLAAGAVASFLVVLVETGIF